MFYSMRFSSDSSRTSERPMQSSRLAHLERVLWATSHRVFLEMAMTLVDINLIDPKEHLS